MYAVIMHSQFSEFNHHAGTAMSRYIINSTCVTTKLRQNFKVTAFLRAAVRKCRLGVCKMKQSKIPKLCQSIGLGKLFLEK